MTYFGHSKIVRARTLQCIGGNKQEIHMTMRIATSALFLSAMLLLPASMASAELAGACLTDAKAMCPGVQPGGGKIRDCLKMHIKDLSDECKDVLVKAVNVKACASDVKQHCGDIKAGEGRLEACLKSHVADLTDACKVALVNSAAGDN
jgi:hypothetical protein